MLLSLPSCCFSWYPTSPPASPCKSSSYGAGIKHAWRRRGTYPSSSPTAFIMVSLCSQATSEILKARRQLVDRPSKDNKQPCVQQRCTAHTGREQQERGTFFLEARTCRGGQARCISHSQQVWARLFVSKAFSYQCSCSQSGHLLKRLADICQPSWTPAQRKALGAEASF